ncbi:MAG TPA: SDR family NAD(P)-dependent oxidoreductase [Solirubrobacteraceae bacterium]|nr:SDR family NAD(P)-dependent oxidoreductase [Solirubrobacteraceae bacterium]
MAGLHGASAAVTGAAHGIGRAIAQHLVQRGAKVAIGDIDEQGAQQAADALGTQALARHLDVSDHDSFSAFLDAAEEAHGPLTLMVNNAGIDWIGPFHEEPDEVSRREIAVNLYGTLLGSKLALQRMLPRDEGHLVNVASGVGRVPLPGSASYAATKHGVVGLTESLRLEYRGANIGFSVIQPAQVDTAMIDGQGRPKALPVVTADDVAAAVVKAVERGTFEVWVPASQAVTAKLAAILPRPAREGVMRALGVTKIAGETDQRARAEYHERAFGRSR